MILNFLSILVLNQLAVTSVTAFHQSHIRDLKKNSKKNSKKKSKKNCKSSKSSVASMVPSVSSVPSMVPTPLKSDGPAGVSSAAPTDFPSIAFDLQVCESYSRRW